MHCIYALCDATTEQIKVLSTPTYRLLWASRIAPEKHPELIHKIASAVIRSFPRLEIEVYGSQCSNSSIELSSGPPNVTYRGSFERFEDIPLSRFDALLYTTKYDGLPNVILEAMASGLSVIAPNVGGVSEVISTDTGFLVANTADLADLVEGYVAGIGELYENWPSTLEKRIAAMSLIHSQHGHSNFQRSIRSALPDLATCESDAVITDLGVCGEGSVLSLTEISPLPSTKSSEANRMIPSIIDADGIHGGSHLATDGLQSWTREALQQRVAELEALVIARDNRITALGSLLSSRQRGVSRLKKSLISLWDALPVAIQRRVEPFADFIDRRIK
jgi:hypothetical protein